MRPSVFKLMHSTFSAMIGIQKKENLEHDFQQKSAVPFIISGLLGGLVFVLSIIGMVQLILFLVLE